MQKLFVAAGKDAPEYETRSTDEAALQNERKI